MICNEMSGMIVERLEEVLNANEKKKFDRHVEKCIKCRRKYFLTKANYNAGFNKKLKGDELEQSVMSRINTSRYAYTASRKLKMKWVLISLAVLISVSVTAFAQPIYKSLEELLKIITINNPGKMNETERIKAQKAFQDADTLYEKYKQNVHEIISGMKAGEVKTLTFKEERDDFYINVGRGTKTKSIIYGIKGNSGYTNMGDIPAIYRVRADFKQMSIQELIEEGYFVPVPEILPEGYEFSDAVFVRDEISSITFKNGKDGYISVQLASDKVVIDDDTEKSLESVNGFQAVYVEKESAGRRCGSLHIYLGENKRQKVITLSANLTKGSLEKSHLVRIAQSMKFYNPESNDVTYNGYFKDIKGPIPQGKLDEFYKRLEKGENNIRVQVDDGVRLSRKEGSGKSETYYIESFGTDYRNIGLYSKLYCNYPLLMNRDVYRDNLLKSFCVVGYGYRKDKSVNFIITKPDADIDNHEDYFYKSSINVNAEPVDSRLKQYPAFDLVIDDYVSCMNNDSGVEPELLFDKDNHPYIAAGAGRIGSKGNETIYGKYFRTIKEVNGDYLQYNIIIPDAMLEGMSDQEFINGIDFIR